MTPDPFPRISDWHYHQWIEITNYDAPHRTFMCMHCGSYRTQPWDLAS